LCFGNDTVIIIIGILAAIAIPFYVNQQRQAEIATCVSDARNAAANLYRAGPGNGSYAGLDAAAAGDLTITTECNNNGNAVWTSGTGRVVPPAN
jgi:Tfp pilus assembly protein PilE